MSADTMPGPLSAVPLRPRSVARRRVVDRLVTSLAWLAAAFGVFIMGWIVVTVVGRGIGAINWAIFTQSPPAGADLGGGLGPCIVGTIVLTGFAAVIGIPIGFFGAVYLSEFGRTGRIATAIRTITNVVLGVPSIIAGLFAYAILVKPLHHYSGFAGSIALAFIMLPVMTRAAEDVLNLVPNELRESALAMGAPRWRATLGVIVRSARAGLITSTILAVVRVAGETAPLLFTALSSPYWLKGLFGPSGFFGGPVANLTKTIYDYSTSPYQHLQQLAWGGALLIIVAVLGTNVLVRVVFQRGK
ncbi:MAG TPA: phosphate ABC transporter permease PstA [Coriobacteriia bacterium]